MPEVTSNVAITEKNEKQYVRQIIQLRIQGSQEAFSDEVTPPDFDDFTDGQVVQCDVQVVRNTFVDNSK